ncbi:ABC transporter ATP-binding protein [Mycolicibacterium mucogenicum]|uniref:ABC transporter ATP-binding protein n=2 Tax=Mycolicibacterium mucogenicum TaxID=56689 RepID=A0A1A3HCJ1_MYCMU|nr:ABC transporter ATP-binding protein [Mycolicibacterium mucogenicum]
MSSVPPLIVTLGGAMFTFPPGKEVTVGRGEASDVRIPDAGPGAKHVVSRLHLIIRVDPGVGQWVAIDKSRNGIFANRTRVPSAVISDDLVLAVGAPDGPQLHFRTATQVIPVAKYRQPPAQMAPPRPTQPIRQPPRPVPQPPPAPAPQRSSGPPAGAVTIGRHSTATIRVDDSLASRIHAYLMPAPTGTQLYDNGSGNGTFVNGHRVEAVTLRPGDVITVGNTDLVFTGGTAVQSRQAVATGGIAVRQVGLAIEGHQLLTNVAFDARPGTLTAVIGPSGAGKSTLIRLLGGVTKPTSGQVTFDGHDVHAHYASLRSRIGMVPQDDVVHRQLTVSQALNYAAELRLPPDTSRDDRHAVVERVLAELELTAHRDKRVNKLSGGQRKRASVALELLTGPSLLILDEPTSGLDPALDRQVMQMLRRLADAGRTVLVVTHSLTYLNMCDQVLLLAPGGKTVYAGPPQAVGSAMGTQDWADIFAWVSANPDAAHAVFLQNNPAANRPAGPPEPAGPLGAPARTSTGRQMLTVARRQLQLIFADRIYTSFLLLLPFILGAMSLIVPGDTGFGVATVGHSPNEPNQLLIVANIAAVFMGTALTIRDLVGERTIFRREQAVGLSAAAYLSAKIVVYSAFTAIQTAIVVAIIVIGKGAPTQGALFLGSSTLDFYVSLTVAAIVSAILGLLLSSLARSSEQILPMLVVVIMLSIVFSGGMIPVTGRVGLDQASWFLPGRWGFAASASVVDLLKIAPLMSVDDQLWHHELRWWALDIGVLVLLGAVAGFVVYRRLRLPGGDAESGAPKAALIVGTVVLAVGFVAGMSYLTRDSGNRPTQPTAPAAPPKAAPPGHRIDLANLLPDGKAVSAVMQSPPMATATIVTAETPRAGTATPPPCAGVADAGGAMTFGPGFTGMSGMELRNPADPNTWMVAYAVGYPGPQAAERIPAAATWLGCANTAVTFTADGRPPRQLAVGGVTSDNGTLTAVFTEPGRSCQHVLTTKADVVVDVLACSPGGGTQAAELAKQIADKVS